MLVCSQQSAPACAEPVVVPVPVPVPVLVPADALVPTVVLYLGVTAEQLSELYFALARWLVAHLAVVELAVELDPAGPLQGFGQDG